MSIETILAGHLGKKLFPLGSLFTGDETGRTMYLSADVSAVVTPPFPETAVGCRLAELRAWFDDFLELSEISVAENPDNKPPDVMLARVRPIKKDFWSVRVTEPANTPGIRVIGAFAGKDCFVALTWDYREDMGDFDGNVTLATECWKDLFGDVPPFTGDELDDYLTNFRAV